MVGGYPVTLVDRGGTPVSLTGALGVAEDAARAEASAAYAESMTGPTYASTAAGLSATSDGQGFAVDNGDGTVTVYLNVGGAAVAQRTLATSAFLASSSGGGAIGLGQGGTVADAVKYYTPQMYGAVADGSTDDHAAIVAALAAAKGSELVFPPGVYRTSGKFELDSNWNDTVIRGDGAKLKFTNVLNTSSIENSWMWLIKDRATAIRGLTIKGLKLDGNRASVTYSGSTPATSFGIYVDQRTLLGEGVEIDSVTASNFVTSGFQVQQGPMVLRFVSSENNGQHGIGFQEDPLGMAFGGWVSVINPRTKNCEGYGIDFAGGKIRCENHFDDGSWYGNAKAAGGLSHLIIRGAQWLNAAGNPADATSGFGFLTTGAGADFADTTLDIDGVYVEGAASSGFLIGAFDGTVKLGKIVCRNNMPSVVATEQGDIHIIADRFTAEHLESHNSTANGITITSACESYNIGYVESQGASRAGFTCRATSGNCDGIIRGGLMVNNNQAGLATSLGAAVQHLAAGNVKVNGIDIRDTQGVATQVAGMYFGLGAKAEVTNSNFGAGIVAGGQVYSASAGTRVAFPGHSNTGIVTRIRGSMVKNGGGTNLTETFATPFTLLGGAVYYATAVPGSADGRGSYHVSVGQTFVQALYASATPAGTSNVTIRYDCEMEIQR